MDTDVRGHVVALELGGITRAPLTDKAGVIGALVANMTRTQMLLEDC
jgi:hypothetical protein